MLKLGRFSSSRIGISMGNSWPFGRRAPTTPPPYHSWTDVVAGTAAEGEGKAMRELASIDVLTFNMLAPCYKRMSTRNATGRRHRESYDRKAWRPRAERTFDFFREEIFPSASIIALQEFWMGEEEYKKMFLDEFERQGFEVLTLQRTGDKVRPSYSFPLLLNSTNNHRNPNPAPAPLYCTARPTPQMDAVALVVKTSEIGRAHV